MMTIVVPLVVLRSLGYGDAMVGFVFAASGVSGMISAFLFGRLDTRGREWTMLVVPIVLMTPLVALLLPAAGVLGPIEPQTGLALLLLLMSLFGFVNGCSDIALFTVRQRRTEPAWIGRAFAVSMALNSMGFPVGSAIAWALVMVSLAATIWTGVVACLGSWCETRVLTG